MDVAAALKWIVISGILVALIFALATVFMPEFRNSGTTLVTVVLGFFGTALTAILGAAAIQRSYDKAKGANGNSYDRSE